MLANGGQRERGRKRKREVEFLEEIHGPNFKIINFGRHLRGTLIQLSTLGIFCIINHYLEFVNYLRKR